MTNKEEETTESIIAWHTETFPKATEIHQLRKFIEELFEAMSAVDTHLDECADVVISATVLTKYDSTAYSQLMAAMSSVSPTVKVAINKKMAVNRQRRWYYDETQGVYRHVKEVHN